MTRADPRAVVAAVAAAVADTPGLRLEPPAVRMPAVTDRSLAAIAITADVVDVRLVATRLPVTNALHILTMKLGSVGEQIGPRRIRLVVVDVEPAAIAHRQ